MGQTHEINIRGRVVIMDLDDALSFVGKQLGISSHGYVKATRKVGGEIYLHQILMNPPKGMMVDHINGNKLDNRRENLRVCNPIENAMNSAVRSNNTSGVRGVHWSKDRQKWVVQISKGGRMYSLGRFDNFEDAVAAREKAEAEMHGEFSARNRVKT